MPVRRSTLIITPETDDYQLLGRAVVVIPWCPSTVHVLKGVERWSVLALRDLLHFEESLGVYLKREELTVSVTYESVGRMVEIVNIVGSGALDVELNLKRLADDIDEPIARYDPDKYPGIYFRFGDDEPLVTVYRTGKYIITGADSEEELYSLREHFLTFFAGLRVVEKPEDEWFSVQNYVCTGDLEGAQDLNALAIGLGLERTEYEPEQFPGLIYRPDSRDCVVLIFATGRVVITGAREFEIAERAFKQLQDTLSERF